MFSHIMFAGIASGNHGIADSVRAGQGETNMNFCRFYNKTMNKIHIGLNEHEPVDKINIILGSIEIILNLLGYCGVCLSLLALNLWGKIDTITTSRCDKK